MSIPEIKYTTYIASTGATLWDALTNPDVTQKYWGDTRLESDWKIGSKLVFRCNGKITDENTVLENEPGELLSYTFEPTHDALKDESPSRVRFSVACNGEVVRLTLVHDQFDEGSDVFKACSLGWPMILSNLKTLLETGECLTSFDFP